MQHKTLILRLTALGDDLTVQFLSNLEPLGDYSCNVLRNMGGKILGYNINLYRSYNESNNVNDVKNHI